MDWIPVLSQVKSLVQVTFGDAEGAKQTQINFSRTCPIVSQTRSLCEVTFCDDGARMARETQMAQIGMLSDFTDGVPLVGHLKGGIHHICGDHEGGNRALKASSHSTCVIAGGAAGFCVGGPVGAVAGGIAGGLALDGTATGIESAVNGEYTPSGHIAGITNIVNKANKGENISGDIFDSIVGITMDGVVGKMAGTQLATAFEAPTFEFTAGDLPATADGLLAAENSNVRGVLNYRSFPILPEPITAGGAGAAAGAGVAGGVNGMNHFYAEPSLSRVPVGEFNGIHLVPIEELSNIPRQLPLDPVRLARVVDGMLGNELLPPVEAYRVNNPNGGVHWVIEDGYHRVQAAAELGHTHVPVNHPVAAARAPGGVRYVPPHLRR